MPGMQAAPETAAKTADSSLTGTCTLDVLTRRTSLLVDRSVATSRSTRDRRTCRPSSLLALTIQRFCSPREVSLVPASFAIEQRLSLIQTVSTREDLLFINVLRSTAVAVPSILCSVRLQVVHRQTIVRDVLRWLFPRANTPSTTFMSWWATP